MQWKDAVCLGGVIAVSLMVGACDTSATEDQQSLSGPYSHENLSIFLVHTTETTAASDMLSFDEAVEKGYLTVFETGDVGELEMENTSDWPVYIQSGSVVKGGRQDRMLPHDIVVAAHSGKKPLASYCVERGRWSARGEESDEVFQVAPAIVADKDILMAAKVEESQSKVWEGVASKVDKFGVHVRGGRAADPISPSSLPMALENDDIQVKARAYVESITSQARSHTDATGLVVVINGTINNVDLYRGKALFEKLFPKLIDAAAVEALARSMDEGAKDEITLEKVAAWLSEAQNGDIQSKNVGGTMFLRSIESKNAISFESSVDSIGNGWIHKSILSK